MPLQRATHALACAHRLRARMIYAAGDPEQPPNGLIARIASNIACCCRHSPLKAYRLAHGWTVSRAVEQFHALCIRDGLGGRGLTQRSWKEWEAGARPNDDYRDLLCRLFRTGPVQLGFGRDYTPLPGGSSQLPSIVGTSDDLWGDTRTALLTVIGEMAALASALLLLDKNQPGEARRHMELAWIAAKEAQSTGLQAIVLGGHSFDVAYAGGDHRAGLELAEAAWQHAKAGASASTRGWVAAIASERCASLGDEDGCRRYLSEARSALHAADCEEAADLGIGVFDDDKLTAYEGSDMVRLGRYGEAAPILDSAIERLAPSMLRHRSTALIDRAEARIEAGEVDAACEDGTCALEIVTQVQHAGNMLRLRRLAKRASDTGSAAGRALWINILGAHDNRKGTIA
jgi:hypothetical protein